MGIKGTEVTKDAAKMVLADDNSAPASGDFKLRIVNAAPGLGPAGVYIVAAGTDLNTVSTFGLGLAKGRDRRGSSRLWENSSSRIR